MNYKIIIKNFPHFSRNKLGWDKISSVFSPASMTPSWPSMDDANHYFQVIKNLGVKESVLILGATPLLRKLAREYPNLFVTDFSKKMIKSMEKFMPEKAIPKEKIYFLNWFSILPKLPTKLDLVLGDLVINELPAKTDEEFLKLINGILKPGGFFITRIQIKNPVINWMDVDGIINLVCEHANYNFSFSPQMLLMMLLSSRMANKAELYYDDVLEVIKPKLQEKEFKRLMETNLLEDFKYPAIKKVFFRLISGSKRYQLMKETFKLSKIVRIRLQIPPKELWEFKVKKFFSIVDILNSKDYPGSENFPIYVLKKPENSFK